MRNGFFYSSLQIAQYFNEVSVTTLDLGQRLPQVINLFPRLDRQHSELRLISALQILSCSLPWQDEHGLWVDLEVEYNGVCQATVLTQGIRLPGKDEPDREAQELARLESALQQVGIFCVFSHVKANT